MNNWTAIDMEAAPAYPEPVQDDQQQEQKRAVLHDEECTEGSLRNVSNTEVYLAQEYVVPSAKEIRANTIEGIQSGILPGYQDYGIVIQYLVKKFLEHDFKFKKVEADVPWLRQWLVNPFNARLLNEELELVARLEAAKIQKQIDFMLHGGICSRTCGKFCGCVCVCAPPVAILCRVCAYFSDLMLYFLWAVLCDWWLGAFCRKYIITYLYLVSKYISLKIEDLLGGGTMYDDEDLSIHNMYDSNSYKIANQYACILLLAITLTVLGACLVTMSYVYLPRHPDVLFIRAESVLGIVLMASGCCGLQFYCRCTL